MSDRSIDLTKVPKDLFRSKTWLAQQVLPIVHDATLRFIESEYPRREGLAEAYRFALYTLQEVPSPAVDYLFRLGFFPWVQASWEFDQALGHALAADYKAAYDCLRRALELTVVAAFFLSSEASEADARAWVSSHAPTPFFNRSVKTLASTNRWRVLSSKTSWPSQLSDLFGRLCDVVHTRGLKHATLVLQPYSTVINGHHLPQFDLEACEKVLDTTLETVSMVAVVVTLTNPTLIVGLPIDEKFGLNPPASGVSNEVEAGRLHALIPEGYRSQLRVLAETDPNSRALIDWVRSRPDLTEEELEEQARRFRD